MGPVPLGVAVVIGLSTQRADWPLITVDAVVVAKRLEVPVATVEAVIVGLEILGFLSNTGEVDRLNRKVYRARLPA